MVPHELQRRVPAEPEVAVAEVQHGVPQRLVRRRHHRAIAGDRIGAEEPIAGVDEQDVARPSLLRQHGRASRDPAAARVHRTGLTRGEVSFGVGRAHQGDARRRGIGRRGAVNDRADDDGATPRQTAPATSDAAGVSVERVISAPGGHHSTFTSSERVIPGEACRRVLRDDGVAVHQVEILP